MSAFWNRSLAAHLQNERSVTPNPGHSGISPIRINVALFRELYDVEDRARGMTASERQALRAAESQPIWARMRDLLDSDAVAGLLPKDKFSEALGHLKNQCDPLQRYLGDGRLPIDNNDVEQLTQVTQLARSNKDLGSISRVSLPRMHIS